MKIVLHYRFAVISSLVGICFIAPLFGQEKSESQDDDPKRAARLEFMRDNVQKITITPTDPADRRDLKIKPQPILRYSDAARGVIDSAVWRVGSKGRPVAIVISEVYGANKKLWMSQEFLALEKPRLTMQSERFTWLPPPVSVLNFQPVKFDEPPAQKPQLRLNQMKRIAAKFTLREFYEGNNIELRLLPRPIDRYEPSNNPNSDGAIFAGVWGVNPEVLMFIETDGASWSYAFVRSGSAKLWALLDDVEVWSVPPTGVTNSMPYSINMDATKVPASIFEN